MNRFEAKWLGQIYAGNDKIKNNNVLIACSGGGDSVALLIFLLAVRNSLGIQLTVAHVNHGLRKEAKIEAKTVRNLCISFGLKLFETKLKSDQYKKLKNIGLETAARELRWTWLKKIAISNDITAVATGHNLDDHTETIMLRLSRGGGIGCITPLSRQQDLRWSPLIQARRLDLRNYLKQKNIFWLEDASNLEPFTPRNRWRKLLEPLRNEAQAIDRHLWESHLQIAELVKFKDYHVKDWRKVRWEIVHDTTPTLLLVKDWEEVELRWTLEAAFQECHWPREADLLRGLSTWMIRNLHKKPNKNKQWGDWQLIPINSIFSSKIKNILSNSNNETLVWALTKISNQIH